MQASQSDLRDILEEEYQALRQGNLTDLGPIASAKKAALDGSRFTEEEMPDILKVSKRNSLLIQAAISGVVAARERLAGNAPDGGLFQTYASDGRRNRVRTAPPTFEKRK